MDDFGSSHRSEAANVRMAALVDASPDAIIGVAPDGAIRTWNRGAELLYGYASVEILGRPVATLSGAERLTEWNGILDRLRSFEPVEHYEALHKHKNGRPLVVSINAFLVPESGDPASRSFGFAAIVRDISPQKMVEQALRETERQYRRIVETAQEGIIGLDENFEINLANARLSVMLGYSVSEMIGQPIQSILQPEEQVKTPVRLRERQTGLPSSDEVCYRHKDGREVWAWTVATPQYDDQGRFQGSFAMLTDITARLTAERELRKSAAQLEELSRRLVSVHEEERRRISQELGELIGKDLAALLLLLEGCTPGDDAGIKVKIARAEERARSALDRVHNLAASVVPEKAADTPVKLTAREREVLAMAAAGSTNSQIGVRLSISARTVETHRRHLMQKLGLSNQTDLVRFAIRYGFVGLGG